MKKLHYIYKMKPYLLHVVLLFVSYSFAQTTEVISLDYLQLQPLLHQNSESVQVVNFWATWCAPCIKELPDLDEAARALAGDDIRVVLVSVDRKGAEHAQAFLAERGVTTALSVHNPMSGWAREMGLRGLPSTFLISRDQSRAYLVQGPAEWAAPEILAEIRDLLATPH